MIQWLDELDDLIAAIGLVSERIRDFFRALSFLTISTLIQCAGVLLALRHPPLAMATAILLFVTLLYCSVTARRTPLGLSAVSSLST